MRWFLLAALAAVPSVSQAQMVSCTLTPAGWYSGVTPTKMELDFDSSLGQVIIKDDVGPKVGKTVNIGEVRRYVGEDILFIWKITSVPLALKPPTETKFYRDTVNYSGRYSPNTKTLSIVGNFVTSVSSANTGLNMRARGRCK